MNSNLDSDLILFFSHRKFSIKNIFLILLIVFFAKSASAYELVTYKEIDGDVINPDRGFFNQSKNINTFKINNKLSRSVHRSYFVIDKFVDKEFTPEMLEELDASLKEQAANGVTVIPRWTYHWPSSIGVMEEVRSKKAKTADQRMMFRHIEQLAPILRKNKKAISYIESGLIGYWGEQHGDTFDKQSDDFMRLFFEKWFKELGDADISVSIRYVNKWKSLLEDNSFDKSTVERIGIWNDCVAYADDQIYRDSVDYDKFSKIPMTGETCQLPAHTDYSCKTMIDYFRAYSFDMLNVDYYPSTIEGWKREGCFNYIESHLGYRFLLRESQISDKGLLTFKVANVGWGKSFKSRKINIIVNGVIINTNIDVKSWLPGKEYVEVVNMGFLPARNAGIKIQIEGNVKFANTTENHIFVTN